MRDPAPFRQSFTDTYPELFPQEKGFVLHSVASRKPNGCLMRRTELRDSCQIRPSKELNGFQRPPNWLQILLVAGSPRGWRT